MVIDTNVAVVANQKAEQASPECVLRCIAKLLYLRDECRILLDNGSLILDEYRRHLHPSGQPGAGDSFYRWLHDNQAQSEHCRRVEVEPHSDRGFENFPTDPSLSSFDQDDRKFVAVALASGTDPKILNASDRDWWQYRQALQEHGVEVDFLCPELMGE